MGDFTAVLRRYSHSLVAVDDDGLGVEEGNALELEQRVVERVRDEIAHHVIRAVNNRQMTQAQRSEYNVGSVQ